MTTFEFIISVLFMQVFVIALRIVNIFVCQFPRLGPILASMELLR